MDEFLNLKAYIQETRALGFDDTQILRELVRNGWSRHIVDAVLAKYSLTVPKPPFIQLSGVSKTYRNDSVLTRALNDINLTIYKGEFAAIMGASGSGKSTLMHILGLLDTPTSGSYKFAGRETRKLKASEKAETRNREIGFVFQQFNLLPRATVLDNVMLPSLYNGTSVGEETAREVVHRVGLSDRIKHRSNQLSGGQMQRVAIARALLMNPGLVLADEPTGNLDSKTAGEIMEIFEKINTRGTTVVVVTHEEDVARRAQKIIRIKDGKIAL